MDRGIKISSTNAYLCVSFVVNDRGGREDETKNVQVSLSNSLHNRLGFVQMSILVRCKLDRSQHTIRKTLIRFRIHRGLGELTIPCNVGFHKCVCDHVLNTLSSTMRVDLFEKRVSRVEEIVPVFDCDVIFDCDFL